MSVIPRLSRPFLVTLLVCLVGSAAIAAVGGGIMLAMRAQARITGSLTVLAGVVVGGLLAGIARGLWMRRNWARVGLMLLIVAGLFLLMADMLFDVLAEIFAGERVMPLGVVIGVLVRAALRAVAVCSIPCVLLYALNRCAPCFDETLAQRTFVDRYIRYLLLAAALSAVAIVFLIVLFTMAEAWESVEKIGVQAMLLGTIWRPGSIVGAESGQFGLLPMIVGSILSTLGALVLGVPLSVGTAILLAEVAPPLVREIIRPAVELLAGIPSVVYGLFGMVVLAPLIREMVPLPYNTGFGLLNASVILAVMIMPTVANIAEDAIRAVPRHYKEGSLALGATHWQTICNVILPAARSGIVAAVILGIGRALGETMAVIMVIGNSIAIPRPLNDNPLTIFLSSARTLTGNIAVEINYAAGPHRSALFFTGVLLFVMIFLTNSLARWVMTKERVVK